MSDNDSVELISFESNTNDLRKRKSDQNDDYETEEAKQIRKIIEQHCGVFKFSTNIKLYCNFCQLELFDYSDENVQKHLYDVGHLENFLKNPSKITTTTTNNNNNNNRKSRSPEIFNGNRCITLVTNELVLVSDDEDETGDPETNKIDIVINAYQSGILANRKFDKIHCIPCDCELRDSLLLVKKHLLKDRLHLKNMLKIENSLKQSSTSDNQELIIGSKKIKEFVENNFECLEWDGPAMIHCKVCHKVIQAKHHNLVRHCQRRSHKSRLELLLSGDKSISTADKIFSEQIQMEKEKLKILIESNQDCLLVHSNQIYCRLCTKIIGTKYNNVLRHLNRSLHVTRKKSAENVNDSNDSINDDQQSSTTTTNLQENVEKIFENLLQKEQNRMNRLLSKHSKHLVFYNQCENILCKPCKRIMLAKYVNIHNHLRRQCHKDKVAIYDQSESNSNSQSTMKIIELTDGNIVSENERESEQNLNHSVETIGQEQVIFIEQISMGDIN
ncbi:hypothetical protein DERP_010128 [Dermatophagoides pteronyssinus]|uniref:C2H2-type domain-containing protein n=1 Tax=Dermatophagoides pteronyssinus TaxID=6956 RepID=A0ABQ8JFI0_DERPT|nr:hypothetical protein DERP_010128 [Dermatophagoides pteronyssinus]